MNSYRVLCAKTKENSFHKGEWLPINGNAHTDRELGVEKEHYHIDWRFIPPQEAQKIAERGGHFNSSDFYFMIIWAEDIEYFDYRYYLVKRLFSPCEYFADWTPLLEEKYAGQVCKGNKCPHKGADLSDCEENEDGNITCPYHGLIINAKTRVVTRDFTSKKLEYDQRKS